MGLFSTLKKTWQFAREAAPVLPIPDKAKRVIGKAGEVEDDIKAIVREIKPPKPVPPAA